MKNNIFRKKGGMYSSTKYFPSENKIGIQFSIHENTEDQTINIITTFTIDNLKFLFTKKLMIPYNRSNNTIYPIATSKYPNTANAYMFSPREILLYKNVYVIETHKNENNSVENITIANDLKFIPFV